MLPSEAEQLVEELREDLPGCGAESVPLTPYTRGDLCPWAVRLDLRAFGVAGEAFLTDRAELDHFLKRFPALAELRDFTKYFRRTATFLIDGKSFSPSVICEMVRVILVSEEAKYFVRCPGVDGCGDCENRFVPYHGMTACWECLQNEGEPIPADELASEVAGAE